MAYTTKLSTAWLVDHSKLESSSVIKSECNLVRLRNRLTLASTFVWMLAFCIDTCKKDTVAKLRISETAGSFKVLTPSLGAYSYIVDVGRLHEEIVAISRVKVDDLSSCRNGSFCNGHHLEGH